MYRLNCIECGYSWHSASADVSECPMCESSEVVVIDKEKETSDE